jgi:hypothetical protein
LSVEAPGRDLSPNEVADLRDIINSDAPYVTERMKDEARRVLRQAGELDDD